MHFVFESLAVVKRLDLSLLPYPSASNRITSIGQYQRSATQGGFHSFLWHSVIFLVHMLAESITLPVYLGKSRLAASPNINRDCLSGILSSIILHMWITLYLLEQCFWTSNMQRDGADRVPRDVQWRNCCHVIKPVARVFQGSAFLPSQHTAKN